MEHKTSYSWTKDLMTDKQNNQTYDTNIGKTKNIYIILRCFESFLTICNGYNILIQIHKMYIPVKSDVRFVKFQIPFQCGAILVISSI